MTERKWTPGPWRAGQDGNLRVYGPDGRGEHSGLVFDVETGKAFKGRANAHLISAAPGLYDALETLVELCNNTSPFGGELQEDRIERTFVAATAALSKARGEA